MRNDVWDLIKSSLRYLQETEVENAPAEGTTTTETGTNTGGETKPRDDSKDRKHKSWLHKTIEGLGYSFAFIFLSELGDKTFLFIVIYASRMNGLKLLIISSIGLCGMHVAATAVGNVFQYFLSEDILKMITVISFFIIGVVLIYMGITGEEESEEERYREVEVEMIEKSSIKYSLDRSDKEMLVDENNKSEGRKEKTKVSKSWYATEAVFIIATIICTEMADRSQISAIMLAANYSFWIVSLAGSLGHILALIIAILFGKAVSHMTSEK